MAELNLKDQKIIKTLRTGVTHKDLFGGKVNRVTYLLDEKDIRKMVNSKSPLYSSLNKLIKKGIVKKDWARIGREKINTYKLTNIGEGESNKLLAVNKKKLFNFYLISFLSLTQKK